MSVLIRTDITAVKFYGNCIFAGIGSSVHVFEKNSGQLIKKVHALKGQKIYGFVASEGSGKLLVFGGKQFTVMSVGRSPHNEDDITFEKLCETVVCDDWLHAAIWMDEEVIALLTAHNVVQKWNTTCLSMESQYPNKNNSILYSGALLCLNDDVLVMAGTVFSDVILHRCGDEEPLHHLRGHKGVIFSISCKPEKGMIVTTSDDRSVRIWQSIADNTHSLNTIDYWKNIDIVCRHELYGHTARVMRNCITYDYIISIGEDSAICYWDHSGKLLRKSITHHNACIWCLDADEENLVTGGGDSSVIIHPLSVAKYYSQIEQLNIDTQVVKQVLFTARRNLFVLNENDEIIHYNADDKSVTKYTLHHESTYKLVSLSGCKQMISVADMSGKLDIFLETCKDRAVLLNIIDVKLNIGKILSKQWAGNRHLVLCSENGHITILASSNNRIESYAKFVLPHCKERWLTASSVNYLNDLFILGDRCGNIHVFVRGSAAPIKTFPKVHGRYGPTSIVIKEDSMITTGRDGTIKYFCIDKENNVKYMYTKDLEFQWVEKFLDKDERFICGFQERVFVVSNVRTNAKILEVECGGGHRSWDAVRYIDRVNDKYEECIRLIYIKNAKVNFATLQLSKIVSRNIINGWHPKEINCMKVFKSDLDRSKTFFISGGEDTTVRVSSVDSKFEFDDEVICKHLSNVRTLKTYFLSNNTLILISAGGRAQIRVSTVEFYLKDGQISFKSHQLMDYQIKGTDKERKGNQTWQNCSIDFDPETRIMDVDLLKRNEEFILFVGCSDAALRVYRLKIEKKSLSLIRENKDHKTCILKVSCFKFQDKDIVITCTTTGEAILWEVQSEDIHLHALLSVRMNKSGVNSLSVKVISDARLLIATGGDDNAIQLNVLEMPDRHNLASAKVALSCCRDKDHSSQVTGLVLLDKYLVSTSIDQRITLFEWSVLGDLVACKFLSQTFTDVADIQGLEVLECCGDKVTVCVFGKGMELVSIPKKSHK